MCEFPWREQEHGDFAFDTGGTIAVDSDGWPTILDTVGAWDAPVAGDQIAAVLVLRSIGSYPEGTYICTFEGEGTLNFQFNGSGTLISPGRYEVEVATADNDGINIQILTTNPADPVRDIKLISPGFESAYNAGARFHPLFLDRLADYTCIRFMKCGGTERGLVVDWTDRPQLTSHTQGDDDRGIALDYMILLCNLLQVDLWVCHPHLCTDDYVTQFSTQVEDELDPGLKCYVEFSNEAWNFIYPVTSWCLSEGTLIGLSKEEFYSRRAVEVMDIWSGVFTGQMDRIIRVMGAQAAVSFNAAVILDFEDAFDHVDALTTAPYMQFTGAFNYDNTWTIADIDQAFAEFNTANINKANVWIVDNAAVASARSLDFVAYEGGQHLVGIGADQNLTALTELFVAMNRDPRMINIYKDHHARWDAAGGLHFSTFDYCDAYSKFGSWGVIERQDQDSAEAVKFQALWSILGMPLPSLI